MAAYGADHQALEKSGVPRNSNRLRQVRRGGPVRLRCGKSEVLSGPNAAHATRSAATS